MKTILGRVHTNKRIISEIHILDDSEKERIHELCNTKRFPFEILATGKPADYSIKDGYLEFNTNSMVMIFEATK